jgi:hypothetical protein
MDPAKRRVIPLFSGGPDDEAPASENSSSSAVAETTAPKRPRQIASPPVIVAPPPSVTNRAGDDGSIAIVVKPPATPTNRLERYSRELPCWMGSLIAHLVLILVLGSLVIHVGPNSSVERLIVLFVGEREPALETTAELWTGAKLADAPGQKNPFERSPSPADDVRLAAAELAASGLDPKATKPDLDTNLPRAVRPDAPGPNQPAPGVAVTQVSGRVVNTKTPTVGSGQPQTPAAVKTAVERDEVQRKYDDIVDRFTKFDIGELTGDEGQRAKREFDALGPEAIPALVRGLNKAARLRASCPVLVISGKLESEYWKSRDPTSLRYMVENLGRDVPADATHRGVIRSLQKRLGVIPETLDDAIVKEAVARGIEKTDRLVKRVKTLRGLSIDLLAKVIEAPDHEGRLLAALLAAQRHGGASDQAKARLIKALVRLLRDKSLRAEAHVALTSICRTRSDDAPASLPTLPDRQWLETREYEGRLDAFLREVVNLEVFNRPAPRFDQYRDLVVPFLEETTGF